MSWILSVRNQKELNIDVVKMGLDQEIKLIIKKSGWNDDDSHDGVYKEFYFRKNYYLRNKFQDFCYTEGIEGDNCINFQINLKKWDEFQSSAKEDLKKINEGLFDFDDYYDSDDEWLKWSLERIIYVSEEIKKLFIKYPEENHYYELLYWQWY